MNLSNFPDKNNLVCFKSQSMNTRTPINMPMNVSKNDSPSKSGFWPGYLGPNFNATCVQSGKVFPVNLQSYRGKMVLLLFFPVDFGYLSPTELVSLQNMLEELQTNNCVVLAISSGSVLSKVAFLSTHKHEGGVEGVKIGLVEDMEGFIVRSYGMKRENSGYSYRSMVLLDTTGVVVARMVMDLPIGLGVMEALWLIKAINDQVVEVSTLPIKQFRKVDNTKAQKKEVEQNEDKNKSGWVSKVKRIFKRML